MSDEFNKVMATAVKNQEQAAELVEKLFAVAQPGAVFSEPITAEGQTVITASEVSVGMGFGFGLGGGSGPKRARGKKAAQKERTEEEPQDKEDLAGIGGGGGGGGGSAARPVAVISINPEGVRVEPVVDPTKIALAFFTTLGSMFFMLSKMRRNYPG
jgi:uncharacterized spore protein YtfJ